MAGKKKALALANAVVRSLPNASERARNRASPRPVVNLYPDLNEGQKGAIVDMDLSTMLGIKCKSLHNPVINWLAPLYDKFSIEFVIPGRGRIPLNPDSVHHTLGLPHGDLPVPYSTDSDIESRLGPIIFPNYTSTPKITEVYKELKEMTDSGENFKQMWIMYLVCTLLAPTTCNKVSNRCYPIMDKFADVPRMGFCKFVCDKLHEELSIGKFSSACLFHLQLLYVDSLDVSGLGLELPETQFVVNKWSKEDIDKVLIADLKRDGSGYGNLEEICNAWIPGVQCDETETEQSIAAPAPYFSPSPPCGTTLEREAQQHRYREKGREGRKREEPAMEGGGGGHHHHHDTAKLLKAVSRTVEPRNFGIGLVAGFLLVTCAYFSTAKFDAIHIALISPGARNAAAGIGTPVKAAADSRQRLGSDLGTPDLEDALSKMGSKAEVLDKDDDGKILPSLETVVRYSSV